MTIATVHTGEQDRKQELTTITGITDSEFEDVCHLTAEICHTPIALTSVIDSGRKWFKSRHPLITAELTADFAFCNQALHHPKDIFVVADLLKDYRFSNHLLATSLPYAVFYCGVPMVDPNGNLLGVICVWDNKPRELQPSQVGALQSLARQVASKIALRAQLALRDDKIEEQKKSYAELEGFATIAAHDLRSPLNAIVSLTDLLKDGYSKQLDQEGADYIDFLHTASLNLSSLVTTVFNYSRATQLIPKQEEDFDFAALVRNVVSLFKIPASVKVIYSNDEQPVHTNRTVLQQVLMSLLDNALKFSDKEKPEIRLSLSNSAESYVIQVSDNGRGISPLQQERIFELFKKHSGRSENDESMGIGLAIAKTLLKKLGGSIAVASVPKEGSTFTIKLPR